ncbi:ATP synthase protein I [Candidatus Hepatincola sp. Av]
MSTQLKNLEQQLLQLKAKHIDRKANNLNKSNSYIIAFNVLLELLAGIIVGATLGYILDKYLHTKYIFFIIFLFVGLLSGILNMYRYLRKKS